MTVSSTEAAYQVADAPEAAPVVAEDSSTNILGEDPLAYLAASNGPGSETVGTSAGQFLGDSGGLTDQGSTIGEQIVQAAQHYLGTPYAWGGTSGRGIDCSGLTGEAYRAAGINLPRISYQQANQGQRVPIKQLRPGDLVAWDNSSRNPGADHIAIYAGNGMIIEAPRPGTVVRQRKLGANEGAWGVRMGWS